MKIGELSARTGCAVSAIRYYEARGLLTKVRRGEGNQRIYDEAAAERLAFIVRCRANGMKLECIERILQYEAQGRDPYSDCEGFRAQIGVYLQEIEKHRRELDRLEAYLETLVVDLADGVKGGKEEGAP